MKILEPNISGQDVLYINKKDLYVKAMDYGVKKMLRHFLISPGVGTWLWITVSPDPSADIDLKDTNEYQAFDKSVNKSVNDPYCTVYSFRDFNELVKEWNNVKYVETITTVYKEDNKNV